MAAGFELRIDPQAGDKIVDSDMGGLVNGEYITSTTVGASITLMAMSDDDWAVVSKSTAADWTEETP